MSFPIELKKGLKPVKLAIFDFDGTLADTYQIFIESLQDMAIRYRFKQFSHDDFDKLRGLNAQEIIKELHIPIWRVPKVLSYFRETVHERINEVGLFSEIPEALQTLADQKIKLALASSNSLSNVETLLGDKTLKLFSSVECGSSIFGKAHRLGKIRQSVAIDKMNTIYIGDEIRDSHAARKIGLQYGAVSWGYTHFQALLSEQPDIAFRTPRDLLELISS